MRREFHVRFCEGGGVRFPSATRLVLVLSREEDARRVMDVLPKRFGRYGLTLHPEKTRLVEFRQPRVGSSPRRGHGRPQTFDVLGLTHLWGRTRRATWVVRRKTAKGRFQRAARRVWEWCREHRHLSLPEQRKNLSQKLRGHYGYYGITGNFVALARFRKVVVYAWRRWLSRRSQRGTLPWEQFNRLLQHHPLPRARIAHSIYVT